MKKSNKTIRGWCVTGDGKPDLTTIRETKKDAIWEFVHRYCTYGWKQLYAQGWRAMEIVVAPAGKK